MQRLYLPPSLRYLEPLRIVASDLMVHTSFVYDLVAAVRPRMVVDVGTGAGAELSIVCQSMRDHEVDGLAYGIDAWEDEEGKDEHDPTRWAALNAHLRTYFRGVSYLLKMPCADGLPHFVEGSVDILRLNPVRAHATLAELVAAWMPRLSAGGVMLCAGVNDLERPDVAKDWLAAAANRENFLFPHGKGLGVLSAPPASGGFPRPELLELLESGDPTDRHDLARFYEHADRHNALRTEVHARWSDLPRKK